MTRTDDAAVAAVPAALPTVAVTRYVTPLREGGSLPGVVEAEDMGTYVCKFRGAGQGVRVLIAEVIAAGLAERLGLLTPRLVVLDLAAAIARYEADEEVQDLLSASVGPNLGVDFLPGAFAPDGDLRIPADTAARILWLDAFIANVDRSWRNPNLLVWHGDPWVIDHGASLWFHHSWPGRVSDPERFARQPWDAGDHVLADRLELTGSVDDAARSLLDDSLLEAVVGRVPEVWLEPVPGAEDVDALRSAYVAHLRARRDSRDWLPGAAR